MNVVVIEPPLPAVTAEDAKLVGVFGDDEDDAYIDILLAVAQSQIDGPNGWLGRSIGLQTLQIELTSGCEISTYRLPLPPFVDVVSDMTVDGVRTYQWRAGYGADPAKPLPAAIKHAIILMAGALRDATPDEGGQIKSRTIDGIGRWDYTLADGASALMQKASEALLSPFRVLSL